MTKAPRLNIPRISLAVATGAIALVSLGTGVAAEAALPTAHATAGKNEIVFHSNRSTGKGVVNPEGDNEIFAVRPDGTGLRQITKNSTDDITPAWSPDGERIAFTSYRDADFENGVFGGEIYVMKASGKGQTRLTEDPALDVDPAWSPDGRQMAFTTFRNGHDDVYKMNADGTREANLTRGSSGDSDPDWSPDGRRIAFVSSRNANGAREPNTEIYGMKADGTEQTRLTRTPEPEGSPAWSPNGRQIALTRLVYDAGTGYTEEIYGMEADGARLTNLSRNAAFDNSPAWSPDGKQIAFVSNRGSDPAFSDTKIYKMKASGARQTAVTGGKPAPQYDAAGPDWNPRP